MGGRFDYVGETVQEILEEIGETEEVRKRWPLVAELLKSVGEWVAKTEEAIDCDLDGEYNEVDREVDLANAGALLDRVVKLMPMCTKDEVEKWQQLTGAERANSFVGDRYPRRMDDAMRSIDLGYYVERDGVLVPATLEEWGKFFENLAHRTLGRSIVSDMEIVTVCTGHNAELTSPPSFYQTGVFQRENHDKLGSMQREWFYSTRQAAERGHQRIIEAVRRGDRLSSIRMERI